MNTHKPYYTFEVWAGQGVPMCQGASNAKSRDGARRAAIRKASKRRRVDWKHAQIVVHGPFGPTVPDVPA